MNADEGSDHFGTNATGQDFPDLVPARMVNEFAYCPRLAYLEWVQGEFAVNADVADGRYVHRVVDNEEGRMPDDLSEEDRIHARSVWLSAPAECLTARIDLIEAEGMLATPVDYKRGAVPDIAERVWEADRVQVCAQGLVLRANGYACEEGIIYYAESKTRIAIPLDEFLIERTRGLVAELRCTAAEGIIPPPLSDSPKCVRCSLNAICLPDEINLLANGCPEEAADDETVRRLLPARDDALPLYVQEQGARIGKHGECFRISLKDTKLGEARMFETSQVCVFGNVQISTQALQEMLTRDIPVVYFTTGGWFYGITHGLSHKNVELRRAQFRAAADPVRCITFASAIVTTKIENCRTLLMRNHVDPPQTVIDELARLSQTARSTENISSLLGIEGMAARHYFQYFSGMLKPRELGEKGWSFDFNGRNRRPPLDPINALLSYAYSLLAKDMTVTIQAAGFDPYQGFYHGPRYGRAALAMDLMEEFRPIIADSVVLWVVNNGVVQLGDFIRRGKAVALKPQARKRFIEAYEKRMDALITHPVFGYRISYRRVLEVQARLFGRVLTGEIAEYPGFRTR